MKTVVILHTNPASRQLALRHRFLWRDAIVAQLPVQRPLPNVENLGCFPSIPARVLERGFDRCSLYLRHRHSRSESQR